MGVVKKEKVFTADDLQRAFISLAKRHPELGESFRGELFEALGLKRDGTEEIRLVDLKFTSRTFNRLDRARIRTLEVLLALTYNDLMNIRNFGVQSMREVNENLLALGYPIKTKK